MRRHLAFLLAALVFSVLTSSAVAAASEQANKVSVLDRDEALRISQAAIGRQLSDHRLVDQNHRGVRISDYRGRPLVINLIYTSCYHSCSVSTRYLGEIVDVAREALGDSTFSVATIGFDSANDRPGRMAVYAARQGIDKPDWSFLSGDARTMTALVDELGFSYAASPKGFDHMAQVTVIDGNGEVYRQIYGDRFEPPALVEPLKEIVWGLDPSSSTLEGWVDNVRLFCTIYDPSTGRYRFDYSIFVAIIVGSLCLAAIAVFIVRAWRENSSPLPH
jgi:protein SCO1/2